MVAQQVVDPRTVVDDTVDGEAELRRPLQAGLTGDGGLEAHAVLRERLERLVLTLAEGRELDEGMAEIRIDPHVGDRDELESVVVDPLHRLGEDLLAQRAHPGRPGICVRRPSLMHPSSVCGCQHRAMPVARWRVDLHADPITVHTWFPLAGLTLLEQAGEVELHFVERALPTERSMWLEVDDRESGTRAAVSLDLVDAAELAAPQRAASADVTFKRSHRPGGYPGTPRVAPYGIQLACRAGGERFCVYARRLLRRRFALRPLASAWRTRPPLVSDYEARPARRGRRVVYQVRAWDPRDGRDAADRTRRNDERAALIRVLREHLGDAFVGGFVDTGFARTTYPDCVATGPSDFRSYLRLIQGCDIGVSTEGLQGSNPYKIAEYLAGAHAIVSSPLRYDVPDGPPPMVTFSTPQDAAQACARLLEDPAAMQAASAAAWDTSYRPDVLLRRRLVDLPSVLAG